MNPVLIRGISEEDDHYHAKDRLIGKEVLGFQKSELNQPPKGFVSGWVVLRNERGTVRLFFHGVRFYGELSLEQKLAVATNLLNEIANNENVAVYNSAIESSHPSVDFTEWQSKVKSFLIELE